MRLTARGRTAYGLLVAVLFTAAVAGWKSASSGPRPLPATGDGAVVTADRMSTSPSTAAPRRVTRRPAATAVGTPAVPVVGGGRFVAAPGDGPVRGTGRLRRYRVQVEAGLAESAVAFATQVERALADPRGWGAGGRLSFQRVATGPADFTVVLAAPAMTDQLCRPLDTAGIYSCFQHGRAVINYLRWRTGAAAYNGDLASYRQYVVMHEVGHALGNSHVDCPAPSALAPTMMQQTKGVGACRPNPWPYPEEED